MFALGESANLLGAGASPQDGRILWSMSGEDLSPWKLDKYWGDPGSHLRGVSSVLLGQDLLLAGPLGCGPWSGWCQPLPHPRMTWGRAAPSLADLC